MEALAEEPAEKSKSEHARALHNLLPARTSWHPAFILRRPLKQRLAIVGIVTIKMRRAVS